MGPYSESTEYRLVGGILRFRHTPMLQWGRTLRARNTLKSIFSFGIQHPASMGPYSESTEYRSFSHKPGTLALLQWGRTLRARNTTRCKKRRRAHSRFNGAVL